MPTNHEWIEDYRSKRHLYERFCLKVRLLLEDILSSNGISYQVVEARAKTVESFAEKIGRAGKTYVQPMEEITDLAGLRIILYYLYYLDDVQQTCNLIQREFKVDDARSIDKSTILAPDQFGYLSVHKIVKLSQPRDRLPEWSPVASLTAEIQVRTVVQHSWAAISHALQYKHEAEVPLQFRRRLTRLAGLLELADQEFAALRQEQLTLKGVLSKKLSGGEIDLAVDADSIEQFVGKSELVKALFRSASRAGLIPLKADDDPGTGISQLTRACLLCGISNVTALESLLESVSSTAETFLREFLQDHKGKPRVSSSHVAAMVVVGTKADELNVNKVAEALDWSPDYAQRVLTAARALVQSQSPRLK
jgi:ppGpp synthetase/RelA/SpoT-type nucleotidyltranferase